MAFDPASMFKQKTLPPRIGRTVDAMAAAQPKASAAPVVDELEVSADPLASDTEEKDEAAGQYIISPEAVSYRDATKQCHLCEYMDTNKQCKILKIPIEPDSGCNTFKSKESEMGMEETPDESVVVVAGKPPQV